MQWGGEEEVALHPPNMSAVEKTVMMQYIRGDFSGAKWKNGEATYLEWGSGGSTSTYGTAAGTAYSLVGGRGAIVRIQLTHSLKPPGRNP